MPKDHSLRSILLIGSGPITIGQASEFDYSGTQALRALKAEGIRVILANSNPATIMTDPELADRVYLEPLQPEFLEMIMEKEKPDGLLPTMGGQTALNLAVSLAERGALERHGTRLLGASLEAIRLAEDRELFKRKMISLDIDVPRSRLVTSVAEGKLALVEIGLPAILRPSFTLGGEGGGIAATGEEFGRLLERGLFLSPARSVLVEESLVGWKEFELEVVRDRNDNVVIVCSIENLDPMGIHTGDSITVAPAQTLTDRQYQRLRDLSKRIIRAIGVDTGGSNIQFAVKPNAPDAGRVVVIEMNPRVSRSSALASKATGFPIAKVAARLAIGYTLDELANEITGTTPASFEPSIDYVVTKVPRFDFEKFAASPPLLGTQMKSVGEVMAIGHTFQESFLKALASLENGWTWLKPTEPEKKQTSDRRPKTGDRRPEPQIETQEQAIVRIERILAQPHAHRIWHVASALRCGILPARISEVTGIDPWFLDQIAGILALEARLRKPLPDWSSQEWLAAKKMGWLDRDLARLAGTSEDEVRRERLARGIKPAYAQVDTCAGEFEAATPYLYSTFSSAKPVPESEPASSVSGLRSSVLILGSGPNRIGQGIEFDYCCVHASQAVRDEGLDSIMLNCNPETVSTDYDVSSRLYFEPLTAEHALGVVGAERQVRGAIVQFGGQTPLKLAGKLAAHPVPILGTPVESIDLAEDRRRFETFMRELETHGLQQPPSRTATSARGALQAASEIGYPVLLRPSYVLGGRGMRVVFDEASLTRFVGEAIEVSEERPVLIDRYLADAIEVDVDAVCDGVDVVIGGVMEHIEEAGIHSGDSACSLPSFTLSPSMVERLRGQTRLLALKLGTVGLINIQFAVKDGEIYVLEANPRASRTIPFVSKAVGVPLAKVAVKVMLGRRLKDLGLARDLDLDLSSCNVKMPVFPFHKFPNADVLLGPEMKSTGEVMGIASRFPEAYAKALLAAGTELPREGRALLSVADADKAGATEIAAKLAAAGFTLEATPGTAAFLRERGTNAARVEKAGKAVSIGELDCVARLAAGHYSLVINTTQGEQAILDSYTIRRTALERRVPYCTLLTTARAFVTAIESVRSRALGVTPLEKRRHV